MNLKLKTRGSTKSGASKTATITGPGLAGEGADNYAPTAPTATANIAGTGTRTLLASSGNASRPGANVIFTATVICGALAALLFVSMIGAAAGAEKLFCILPIFDKLNPGYPTTNLVVEINRLKAQVGQNRTNFRVGFSCIQPSDADLRRYCQVAQTNNISLGVIMAIQTHSVPNTIASIAAADFRNYQWRLDGVTWQGAVGTNGSPLYPSRDFRVVSPSRYATVLRAEYERLARSQATGVVSVLNNYPGVLVAVNAVIEEELATGGQNYDAYLGDYSPFAITEFRDWLRHTGKYDDATGQFAGQGAGEAIVGDFISIDGVLRSQFYDDSSPADANGTGQSFNTWFGTSFTTWSLRCWDTALFPASITNTNFSPTPQSGTGFTSGGFDAPRVRSVTNAFWKAWSWDYQDQGNLYPAGNPTSPAFGFRQMMVRSFANDLLGWVADQGVPANLLYAHQIPGEPVGTNQNRSGATPIWTGLLSLNRQLGITRFGSLDTDQLQQYSTDWGIFEWHPMPYAAAADPTLRTTAMSQLDSYYWTGARCLFPGWWLETGVPVSTTFPLADSQFAVGLHDWLNARPDVPPPLEGGGSGLLGIYYANTTLADPAVLTNVAGVVNFNWVGASPGPGVSGNNFSARWSGWVQPRYTEMYTFYVTSDDGARLWVNGQSVMVDWVSHSSRERSGAITLSAGQLYDIKLEYYQNTGASTVTLSWASANQPKQIVPRSQLFPPDQTNAPPTVSLVSPMSGITLATNRVLLSAYAADRDGAVTNVEFFANGSKLGETTNALSPTLDVTGVSPGSYLVTVRATDNRGASTVSLPSLVNLVSLSPTNPLAWYKLEGNANDSSGNGFHGTPNNISYLAGRVDAQAALFNGTNSYIQIPRCVSNDFTVAFWVNTTQTGGAGQWWAGKGLVDGEVSANTNDFGLSLVGTKAAFGVGKPDTTITSSLAINDGQWHHVAATRLNTSGAMNLYVDGVWQASATGPAGARTVPPNLRIGSLQTGINFSSGSIDDVRIYGSALSGAQIATLAHPISPTTTVLASSLNPAPTGTNVTFTATVTAVFPGNGTPTNQVRFLTNGVWAALVNLNATTQAAYATSLLPHGTNTVTAEYLSDGSFLVSTGSVTQLVNTSPTASALTLGAVSGLPATLRIIGGPNAPTDPDHDPLTVTGAGSPSHGTASTDGTNVTYIATGGFVGSDSFTYTVRDGYGGTATNSVTVSVIANSADLNRLFAALSGEDVVLTYPGIPGNNYALERTFSLTPPEWLPIVTNPASANGYIMFTNPLQPGTNNFWRTRQVP